MVVASAKVGFDCSCGFFGKEDEAGFAAFATHGKFAALEVDVVAIEFLEFADAEAGGI